VYPISYSRVESRATNPSFDQEDAEDPEYSVPENECSNGNEGVMSLPTMYIPCWYLDASAFLYMHCLDELHSHLISLALIIWYIPIPCFTYFGTSYSPLASPIYQLSIILLLDYGWHSGLGLRCGRSWCVLAWVLGAFFLDLFWWERAIRLLLNACLRKMRSGLLPEWRVGRDGDGECSLSTLKDRSSV
jgi:hypothetical protein